MKLLLLLMILYKPIPKVLFLTSSFDGRGVLPPGAHLVLEEFSRHGAEVYFHDKSIIYSPESLKLFNIIIVPTSYGYHDVDRTLSLTYMDSISMENLLEWVKNGGFLIAGGNVGRNTLSGRDRFISGSILDRKEWPLGRAFGFDMVEVNLKGFSLIKRKDCRLFDWFNSPVVDTIKDDDWILLPVNQDRGVENLMIWTNGKKKYGGVTLNKFGKGYAMLFTSFLLLHPSFDGGWADIPEITRFYHNFFLFYLGLDKYSTGVDPWPSGKQAVLAITLDDGGKMGEYELTLKSLLSRVPGVTFFVTGVLDGEILKFIKKFKEVELGNHSYDHPFFRDLNLTQSIAEIKMTEKVIGKTDGFRFPYVNYTPEGFYALWTHGFRYESSIRVDHLNTFQGAIFPYNLVFSFGKNLITSNLIELSPVKSDWFFYQKIYADNYPEKEQIESQKAYYSYLSTMWEIIRDARGVMVQMGHPMYQGHKKRFLEPLLKFIEDVKGEKSAWITTLGEVYRWWILRNSVRVEVEEKKDKINYRFDNPGREIKGFSVWFDVESDKEPSVKFKNCKGYFFSRKHNGFLRYHLVLNLPSGRSGVEITIK